MATHDDSAEETEVSEQRKRFTIPPQDESVQRWVSEQINLSTSLRLAIREWIERHGYGDATCLPVAQLPPRGRPPRRLSEDDGIEDSGGDEPLAQDDEDDDSSADPDGTESETGPTDESDDTDDQGDAAPAADDDEPVNMDSIFAANRH